MYQQERIYQILQLLKEKQTLTNQEIMNEFHISRDSARRDILKIVNEGKAERTHGGITLCTIHDQVGAYNVRKEQNVLAKKAIAKQAIQYLTVHKICFFDVSTTVYEICALVDKNIEAYTHSLSNIDVLAKHCDTYMVGGKYNQKNRFMYGSQVLNVLDDIYFDFAYIGAAAIKEDGIYVEDFEDAAIKKKLAKRCACLCVVADQSKYLKTSKYRALQWKEINMLCIDAFPPENILKEIRNAGCCLDVIKK